MSQKNAIYTALIAVAVVIGWERYKAKQATS